MAACDSSLTESFRTIRDRRWQQRNADHKEFD